MHIALTPFYKDIFDEDVPEIEELIADVPSSVIVTYLAYLNSKLHLNSSIENQIGIINEMLQRQSFETKNKVKEKLMYFIKKNNDNQDVGLVLRLHLLSLIHIALCNFKEFDFVETTPEQELNIFKAYLAVVDQKAKEASETYLREREVGDGDFFQKHTWPVLFNQMEATPHYDPITDLIKAMCFFNFLEYHTGYSVYVTKFVNKCGYKSTWEYVIGLINIIKQRWENKNKSFSISCDDNTKPLYESLCINPITYRQKFENKIEHHSIMKATPLFKFNEKYVVLDWSYLYNKLYDGLVFDFFNRSGIKELQDLNTIPKFKKFIGKKITEEFTFQKLLTGIFNKKYAHLLFPEDDSKGEPDAYYRENNKVVLFEIKDSFFASNVLTSNSYLQIKSEIDKKYNNPKKGTGQILKHIQRLKETSFEKKSYTELKKKPKNFIIYPVIVYTDIHFGMPGVNNYISQEFEEQLSLLNLKKSFRRIEKLTFLNLSFVIKYFNCIKDTGLINILEKVQHEIEKRRKKHEYKREIDFLFRYNNPPEQIMEEIIGCNSGYEIDFKELAQLLNLTEGLPK